MNLLVKSKMEISSNLVTFSKNTNFTYLVMSKQSWKFFQIFVVAIWKYLNFTTATILTLETFPLLLFAFTFTFSKIYLPLLLCLKIWRESKVNIWLPGWRPWTSCVLWSLWKRQTFAKYCGSNARLHWKTQPGKQLFWHWWGLYQHGPGMSKFKNFI